MDDKIEILFSQVHSSYDYDWYSYNCLLWICDPIEDLSCFVIINYLILSHNFGTLMYYIGFMIHNIANNIVFLYYCNTYNYVISLYIM